VSRIEELKRQVAAGEYVVDPDAVAGAVMKRLSEVLEPRELDGRPVRPEQPDAAAGDD
jgi:hypothetical protein